MTCKQFIAALLLAICAAGPAMADSHQSDKRIVTVSGSGEISVAPDRAMVSMSVAATRPEVKSAQDEVNKVVAAFLKVGGELRIPEKHIKTAQLSIRPEYEWNQQTRERRFIGYHVSRQLEVELHDLDKLGLLFERATAVGVNQVSGTQLETSRRTELRREALSRAAEDARLNAESVAGTLNAKVGDVRHIVATELGYQPPPVPRAMARMANAENAGAETYTTGEIKLSAQITVEFDLLVD